MANKRLTIFTPTYNRSEKLQMLYKSLCKQTSKDFIWIIVDDGSQDDTEKLVKSWKLEGKIDIQYKKQENQGKSVAHNQGVLLTKTEFFCCVDSDDSLVENSIELINNAIKKMKTSDIGIIAFRSVTKVKKKISKNTRVRFREVGKLGITGDLMLVFRINLLKKYLFPKIENEKFVPEAYVYDQLDQLGEMLIIPRVLYIGEYLEDGYTKNMTKLIMDNPLGYLKWIEQRIDIDRAKKDIFIDLIKYVAVSIYMNKKLIVQESRYPVICLVAYPFGWLFFKKRYKVKSENDYNTSFISK